MGRIKLLMAVVSEEDARAVTEELVKEGFRFTKFASRGGFLGEGSVTFLVGVEDEKVEALVGVFRKICKHRRKTVVPLFPTISSPESFIPVAPVEVEVGGAVIFVIPVERVERV